MGYPMTWQRLLNRNGLNPPVSGSPSKWTLDVNMSKDADGTCGPVRRERLERFAHDAKMFVMDLGRLEADATDEDAIAAQISRRTGLSVDSRAGGGDKNWQRHWMPSGPRCRSELRRSGAHAHGPLPQMELQKGEADKARSILAAREKADSAWRMWNEACHDIDVLTKRAEAAESLAGNSRALEEALEALVAVQNGSPLPKYDKEWEVAMELARAALSAGQRGDS